MICVFLDVETTGLDPETCSIFQLSGKIKKGGKEKEFDFRIRPYKGETIAEAAFLATGVGQQELESYPDSKEVFPKFIELLDEFEVGKTYADKAYIIGYNSEFDCRFLRNFFEFHGDTKYGYRFWWPDLDVAKLAALYLAPQRGNMRSFKLVSVYKEVFGKEFNNAHNAMSDIKATEELFYYLSNKMLLPLMKENNVNS